MGSGLSSTLTGATKSISRTCAVCGTAYLQSAGHVCPLGGSTAKAEDGLDGAVIDDRYRIDKMLSKGGMGMVYKATHTVLDKPLAFKVMLQPQDEEARKRFLLEAKLAVQVRHRNIVDVVDFGVLSTNQPFLVMEFLVGQTLAELIEQGPIPPARMCFLAAQVACGLAEVHKKGIVHRDLKPANIFVIKQSGVDVVKVVDFGIATQTANTPGSARLTAPGMVLGTAEYMAPEQAQGLPVDERLDQYALGCIMWEMLTGRVPFDGGHPTATMLKHLTDRVKPPSEVAPNSRIPPELDQIVLRTMSKEPAGRYSSMAELEEALSALFSQLKQRSPSTAGLQLIRMPAESEPVHTPICGGVSWNRADLWRCDEPTLAAAAPSRDRSDSSRWQASDRGALAGGFSATRCRGLQRSRWKKARCDPMAERRTADQRPHRDRATQARISGETAIAQQKHR